MAVNSSAAANEFLRLARAEAKQLTPLQLMKLVYIAHGWMLALYHRPLISDGIEAWKYGPVIPELYHAMKKYGGGSVLDDLPVPDTHLNGHLDVVEKNLIQQISHLYGNVNGIQLSTLTHQAGTPWSITYKSGVRHAPIANDLIAEHYLKLYNERIHSTTTAAAAA